MKVLQLKTVTIFVLRYQSNIAYKYIVETDLLLLLD